jgi:hypothetical protein
LGESLYHLHVTCTSHETEIEPYRFSKKKFIVHDTGSLVSNIEVSNNLETVFEAKNIQQNTVTTVSDSLHFDICCVIGVPAVSVNE